MTHTKLFGLTQGPKDSPESMLRDLQIMYQNLQRDYYDVVRQRDEALKELQQHKALLNTTTDNTLSRDDD